MSENKVIAENDISERLCAANNNYKLELLLQEHGIEKWDAYNANRKLNNIAIEILRLKEKYRVKYLCDRFNQLINKEITQEDIDKEHQPVDEINLKIKELEQERKEKERIEEQRELEEKQKSKLIQAAKYLCEIQLGFSGIELENYVKYIVDEIQVGTCEYFDILKEVEIVHKEEEERKRESKLKQSVENKKILEALFEEEEKKKEEEYKTFISKEQFLFDDLLIQRQVNSTRFLLPNENNKEITAYRIIERLAGKAFKSYAKKTIIDNENIELLPYSERTRIAFYYRLQYKVSPMLDNAKTIVAFINTALKYTDNKDLSTNWNACLDAINKSNVFQDDDLIQEKAASLLVYYGFASQYKKEYPRKENTFYTVDIKDDTRYYNIVSDNITFRFMAIESYSFTNEVKEIITSKYLKYNDKRNKLQAILMPHLWSYNGVKMGLIKEAYDKCINRVLKYIDSLLKYKESNGISLEEYINSIKIDKSETGIIFAEPQQFNISKDNILFLDYKYNIDAEYNKENGAKQGAARSEKAAERNMEKVIANTGDILTTKELYEMGIDKDKIPRLIKNGKIERTKRGYYRIISS